MLTIKNNQSPSPKHDPKVGDFYGRFDDNTALYLVVTHNDHCGRKYGLIYISNGEMYSDPKNTIDNIFGDYSDKFYLITKDIKITID